MKERWEEEGATSLSSVQTVHVGAIINNIRSVETVKCSFSADLQFVMVWKISAEAIQEFLQYAEQLDKRQGIYTFDMTELKRFASTSFNMTRFRSKCRFYEPLISNAMQREDRQDILVLRSIDKSQYELRREVRIVGVFNQDYR